MITLRIGSLQEQYSCISRLRMRSAEHQTEALCPRKGNESRSSYLSPFLMPSVACSPFATPDILCALKKQSLACTITLSGNQLYFMTIRLVKERVVGFTGKFYSKRFSILSVGISHFLSTITCFMGFEHMLFFEQMDDITVERSEVYSRPQKRRKVHLQQPIKPLYKNKYVLLCYTIGEFNFIYEQFLLENRKIIQFRK